MISIQPRNSIRAQVNIPGSKSITHRALVAAGLAPGESRIANYLDCEDTRYTIQGLQGMGVPISVGEQEVVVSGTGGTFPPVSGDPREIFLGNSGTSYRFLLSIAALASGEFLLTGTPRMHERPIQDLVQALRGLGVEAAYEGEELYPPVLIRAKGIPGGKVNMPGDKSSQYISSLLLAGPCMEKGIDIEVQGDMVSQPYLDLTLHTMEQFGVSPQRRGYRTFHISPDQAYRPRMFRVEGDASSGSYFWAAAAVTGGTVRTNNIFAYTALQGDMGLLDILEKMGCSVVRKPDYVVVHGGDLQGIDVDMGKMPDMVPTLAAVALFARGETRIRNVPHLRYKESDRLEAVATEWQRLGARVEELPDGLIIQGGDPLRGAETDPRDDHRIAMALAVVGLRVPDLQIDNGECVNKSFPLFWDMWKTL
jgi:3-phosphoshikimate 1-carboxyvinyltransferase